MEFINLNTGKLYNGNPPYTHYFNNPCGVGFVYSMPICFLYDKEVANITLNSQVFFLLDISDAVENEYINDFKYKDIASLKTNAISSTGVKYEDYYIHIIYIAACSNQAAEITDSFYIDGQEFSVGIDVYEDDESLYVNLSNFGINIPNQIQKAIYPSNVHEDKEDKILLNRKWKELLSNYWDIIANKGSYKSLINSLKWFEWGDLLQLKELWKYNDVDKKVKYKEEDIKQYIYNLYNAEMTRFAKTTYYSIGLALYEFSGVDINKNPHPIRKQLQKWSIQDISLKLSLLGSFFETYFLPIHLDIIKCTIEDIVFTNNIKLTTSSNGIITQSHTSSEYIKCNITDKNNKFVLSNVSVQVNNKTPFNTGIQMYDKTYIMGVDNIIYTIDNDDELKLFMSQNYTGVGAIINVQFEIPLNTGDFIQAEQLFIKSNLIEEWIRSDENIIIKEQENLAKFSFNILCTEEANYELKINFITGSGKILNKTIDFEIIDDIEINIGIFKIKNHDPSLNAWFGTLSNDYNISLQNKPTPSDYLNNPSKYNLLQYIPVDSNRKTGVRLNTVMIFYIEDKNRNYFEENHEYLRDNYFITHNDKLLITPEGETVTNRYQYTICVSKEFYEPGNYNSDPTLWLNTAPDSPLKHLYKISHEYFPEFHYLQELEGNTINDYTVYDNDAICAVPFISGDRSNSLKYGKIIEPVEWIFENITTGKTIKIDRSIREPYITNGRLEKELDYGYYNIIFNYILGSKLKTIKLDSAFRKINKINLE